MREKEASGGFINKENLKQVLGNIKAKNAVFKQQSSVLKDVKSERAILANTDMLLQRRLEDAREKLHNMEVERNMVGQSEMHNQIEDVSKLKNELDKGKENLMEELSKDVEKITSMISQKKKEIEPLIQERKKTNEEVSKLEKVFNDKKSHYDSVISDVETRLERLKTELASTESDCSTYENRLFHFKTMEK